MAPWKNANLVMPGLYVGNLEAAKSTRWLQERGITHAVSACAEALPFDRTESGVRQLRIAIPNLPYVDLITNLGRACQFIDAALAQGGAVLVLSTEGQSRSAAIAAAYMVTKGLSVTDAIDRVRSVRGNTLINEGFQEQLIIFKMDQCNPDPSRGAYFIWLTRMARASEGSQSSG